MRHVIVFEGPTGQRETVKIDPSRYQAEHVRVAACDAVMAAQWTLGCDHTQLRVVRKFTQGS